VSAGGGGNNMLMVSACQTAVKLTWQPASQGQLPSVLACHNSQFWTQLSWPYSRRFAGHIGGTACVLIDLPHHSA
jgi:hypothetical protein